MASQTQGIQQLLIAEKKAAEKVQEARKKKARRLKQAKEEASLEIERFRFERENQFREYESKHMGSMDTVKDSIEQETKVKLEEMRNSVVKAKEIVIKDLLTRVICDVQPRLHTNLRLSEL
ncbi:V-type proton ATPase subunit G [Sarcoptes scabiei]|uniref:V-type proton ATPase subunit G n=1 Tax=Sarcoptes scabiei TaxID=52283 RepID=A0A132AHQ2_SARSC|nr:V-type proton ATPase subunit G [Sarcoptes scabiei]KPM10522.1 V-type proton ATPase subunit G-like protein [Sarcoptes scabiei]UXI16121.1 hypothetical protein NH340_JMT02064 [Sarcoptes scabiei]